MKEVNAKCPNCGEVVLIDKRKEASVCPSCKDAFITEKAIALFNEGSACEETKKRKKRHVFKSLGYALLMVLECVGYLLYAISLLWLFIDITDKFTKKK